MKAILSIKLIMLFSLISMTLSYSIMVGAYSKDSFASNDARLNSAFTMVSKEVVEKNGGASSAEVLPVAVYRQIVNGINYKMIVALKDNQNKKVDLIHSVIYTGPFSNALTEQTPTITYLEMLPNFSLKLEETTTLALQIYLTSNLKAASTPSQKIHSVASYPFVVQGESYFVVNADINVEGKTVNKFFILSQERGQAFKILHNFEF